MRDIKYWFIILSTCLTFTNLNAQNTIPITGSTNKHNIEIGFGTTKNVVKLDPLTRLPIGNIPFDRTFILRVYFDKNRDLEVSSFYLHDKNAKGDKTNRTPLIFYLLQSLTTEQIKFYDKSDDMLGAYPNAIDIVIPPLYPNHDYEIIYATVLTKDAINHYLNVFNLFYIGKIEEGKKLQTEYKKAYEVKGDTGVPAEGLTFQYYDDYKLRLIYDKHGGDTSKANKEVIEFMAKNSKLNTVINSTTITILDFFNPISSYATLSKVGTYVYTIQGSSKLRIVADGGLIYTGWQKRFNAATSYIGINVSLRPIDTDIPFKTLIRNKRVTLCQRFTVNLGMTLNSISKDNYRANLFSNSNVMIGIGFKASHVINLNAGGLLYNNIDPNPLITKKTAGIAPYTGISFNLLIKDALGDIAKVFSYGK